MTYKKFVYRIFFFALLFGCSTKEPSTAIDNENTVKEPLEEIEDEVVSDIELNLRVHLMVGIEMEHPTGFVMNSWVTPEDVEETIIPELNTIWQQAGIQWTIESILEEEVVKGDTYQESLNYIVNAKRDSEGRSDPERLPHLYALMQPENRSSKAQLGKNLFHIYLFPFIGNTSQGNAMNGFNKHSIVGTWTNKHNGGGVPDKTLLTEGQNSFTRGSLSRTIAHEIGHVLTLSHNECANHCLMGGTNSDGYQMNEMQIIASRIEAIGRSFD